ncbi:hypothetical protein ACNKHS_01060 [Shigella flexneri]
MGATLLLERCKPDVIINTGSAGGLAPTLKVGDIVVSDERVTTMQCHRIRLRISSASGLPGRFESG